MKTHNRIWTTERERHNSKTKSATVLEIRGNIITLSYKPVACSKVLTKDLERESYSIHLYIHVKVKKNKRRDIDIQQLITQHLTHLQH